MTFDGSNRETCPNMTAVSGQDRYAEFTLHGKITVLNESVDPLFGTDDFNRECFNICETGSINNEDVPTLHHYIENGVCKSCPTATDTEAIENLGDMAEMCSNLPAGLDLYPGTTAPTWFIRHQEFNLREDFRNRINWNSESVRQYWNNTNTPLTDEEIVRRIGIRRPGTTEYSLPSGFDTIQQLRVAINDGRGSVVVCDDNTRPDWITDQNPCSVDDLDIAHFSPEHIIAEEVQDFIVERFNQGLIDRETTSGQRAIQSFSELLAGISGDSIFEACVNDKLNTGLLNSDGDDDETIQSRIASYTTISQFQNSDIHYLKRKLRKIVTIRTNDVSECMNLLNLGQSVCRTGVADKTLQIGSLIFSIVGNDRVDILNMNNDERIKLNIMIDELGPLIPQAIKNIIRVSKEYEARICNVPSNTTLLLERVYTDLYDKPTAVTLDFSPYIDFNSLINIDDNVKFIKTLVVLVVFAYLFMHFANIVVAFLSRSSNVTKIV